MTHRFGAQSVGDRHLDIRALRRQPPVVELILQIRLALENLDLLLRQAIQPLPVAMHHELVELQPRFASQMAFIHQEVYVENKPNLGLRPQLKAFHLQTEPWLFTINRRGVIAARLEGAFGVNELHQALQSALK